MKLNIRNDFAALTQKVNGVPLTYLDSAATALKPREVVDTLTQFYSYEAANVHRGAHYLSDRATQKYENVRTKARAFLNAKSSDEIIFTKGTTEGINLIAHSWGRHNLNAGDEILISEMEHHSNIVPWQILAEEKGAVVKFVSVTDSGELDFENFKALLSKKTKLVSLTHCSNTLGTRNDLKPYIKLAKAAGAIFVIDAAQSATIEPIDVQDLGCDFLTFSGHKLYGPFGVGILFGREELLREMTPFNGGGAMISSVTKEKTTFAAPPQRFEAGTPNVSAVIGLGAAFDYVQRIGLKNIFEHDRELVIYANEKLKSIEGLRIIGQSPSKASITSFVISGLHPADVGQILDQQGVAVRVGHHCTQPLMKRFEIQCTVRASFAAYNNIEDVEILYNSLTKAQRMLK